MWRGKKKKSKWGIRLLAKEKQQTNKQFQEEISMGKSEKKIKRRKKEIKKKKKKKNGGKQLARSRWEGTQIGKWGCLFGFGVEMEMNLCKGIKGCPFLGVFKRFGRVKGNEIELKVGTVSTSFWSLHDWWCWWRC